MQLEGDCYGDTTGTYSVTLTVKDLPLSPASSPRTSRRMLSTSSICLSAFHPNDVVSRFPDGRCLWENSKVISVSLYSPKCFPPTLKRASKSLTLL